jgi:hypothetical protein
LVHTLLWDHRPSLRKRDKTTKSTDASVNIETEGVEWRDTYSLVCNMANLYSSKRLSKSPTRKSKKVSELHRLCIAIHMSYNDESDLGHKEYVYSPKHMVYNTLCMVIQTKYFRLLKPHKIDTSDENLANDPPIRSLIQEISKKEYESVNSCWENLKYTPDEVVTVHELAFGCMGEVASKVSIWINLPTVAEINNQEIKRLKRNRQRKLLENGAKDVAAKPSPFPGHKMPSRDAHLSTRFSTINVGFEDHPQKPFFHMRPESKSSYQLIRSILNHRISVLVLREYKCENTVSEGRQRILDKESELQVGFESIKKHSMTWKWPATKGREESTEKTSVPSCRVNYSPSKEKSLAASMWNSFVDKVPALKCEEEMKKDNTSCGSLSIFRELSKGRSIHKDRVLPSLTQHSTLKVAEGPRSHDYPTEAWMSILVNTEEKQGWDLIKDHYIGANEQKKDKNMPLSPSHGEKSLKQ